MNKIACPKCGRQYQINANLAGKTVKCANCSQSFVVGQTGRPPAATTAPQQRPPSRPAELPSQELGSLSKLFPNQLPQGPDPLANHVVDDPGFMEVDVDQIREQRELEAQKNNKLVDAFSSSSSIDDLDENKNPKRSQRGKNTGYLSTDNLFGFRGRVSRKTYWLTHLIFGLLMGGIDFAALAFVFVLFLVMGSRENEDIFGVAFLIAYFIVPVLTAIPAAWMQVAQGVKRFHDRNKTGLWLLIALIPIIGPIWLFIELGFLKGTDGKNQYGPDPLRLASNPPKPPMRSV